MSEKKEDKDEDVIKPVEVKIIKEKDEEIEEDPDYEEFDITEEEIKESKV